MADYETLLIERHDAVTLVRLNRPQALNALNTQVLADLIHAFAAYDADPEQRCLVLTGSEKAFAAGADIKQMQAKGFAEMYAENFFAGFEQVTRTRKPWIAAVAGFALGGGCELAMMADIMIVADNAKFGQPEIKIGVAPGMGGSQRLTRAVGKSKAMDMCLTGRMMDAVEAEKGNLCSKIVPLAELVPAALDMAKTIASMPPLAAIANKEMVNLAFESTLGTGILFERRLFNGLTATDDKAEGMTAFVEKRAANWAGR
ncbi:enoyl-CoA hydratase-related protein [Sphingomonas jatrophae]|uniref:enoyl-CoA hydratase n=1 Tax=Sphingomonas jatrophae TaxID=1166337 RepID=A0A1I6LJE8_9SPHN|nr:enoyl-CoA hydratase-related protein [Sphingomonas jatrophae]SFS03584.1 enoyl-CoA hydratase [Sphingomonas jatrophae]